MYRNEDNLHLATRLISLANWEDDIIDFIDEEVDDYLNMEDSKEIICEEEGNYESYLDYVIERAKANKNTIQERCEYVMEHIATIVRDSWGAYAKYNLEEVGLDTIYITMCWIMV